MQILHKLYSFKINQKDMVEIYILYIRSILEFNCPVWHYSLSQQDQENLERVQKVACRVILKAHYTTYLDALDVLGLETLVARRNQLCVNFAKKCIKHPKVADMFPLNMAKDHNTRAREIFYVQPAKTSRLKNSAIPQMQRALNNLIIK